MSVLSTILQALEGLNRLTKGLTLQICTVKRPAVGERLAVLLQASLSILQVLIKTQSPSLLLNPTDSFWLPNFWLHLLVNVTCHFTDQL